MIDRVVFDVEPTPAQLEKATRRSPGWCLPLLSVVMLWNSGPLFADEFREGVVGVQRLRIEANQLLVQGTGMSGTRDSLFEESPKADAPGKKPISRDSLFDDSSAGKPLSESAWRGFLQGEVARAYRDPDHWSKARFRADLSLQGQLSELVKWKIGGRLDYDAAYDQGSFYAPEVRRDQRYEFTFRENYLDVATGGDWEFRIGRQHIVWGELVGAFVADVVSARDMREFILPEPDLQMLRIPQWALRAEHFGKDVKAEVLWIPVPSFDNIGKPGIPGVKGLASADFYPFPIPGPGGSVFKGEDQPSRKLSNTNYGLRISALKEGWDFSGFYYHSLDNSPTFYRTVLPGPTPALPLFQYQARHDKIDQLGGTLSKDLGSMVFKGELVFTDGRKFNVTRISQPDGLVEQETIDYALGLDLSLPNDARLNLQFLQRIYFDHDPDTLQQKFESVVSILFDAVKLASNLEGRLLLVRSLNRSDWLLRPKVTWTFEKNWRWAAGVDVFGGPPTGLFGRFDNNDRVYTELRYSF